MTTRSTIEWTFAILLSLGMVGCGDDDTTPGTDAGNPGTDAGMRTDAGQRDSGSTQDSGSSQDAGTDAGTVTDASTDGSMMVDSSFSIDAGTDAGTDAGPPPLDDTACDDVFASAARCNSYNDSAPGWLPSGDNSSIELSSDQAYRGAQSIFASTTVTDEHAFVQQGFDSISPVTSGMLYMRGYFYFPEVADADFDGWIVMFLQENASPWGDLRFELNGDYVPRLHSQMSGGSQMDGASSIPTDQWLCVQVTVNVGAAGSAQLHIDGELVAEITGTNTLPTNGYSHMMSGIGWNGGGEATSVYMDELVVDTSPTPCD